MGDFPLPCLIEGIQDAHEVTNKLMGTTWRQISGETCVWFPAKFPGKKQTIESTKMLPFGDLT